MQNLKERKIWERAIALLNDESKGAISPNIFIPLTSPVLLKFSNKLAIKYQKERRLQ